MLNCVGESIVFVICMILQLFWRKTVLFLQFVWFLSIKSLSPGDVIWHTSWSTLVQVMAWCLMALSHYLNQCRVTTNEILWHSFQHNVFLNTEEINIWVVLWNLHIQNHIQVTMSYVCTGNRNPFWKHIKNPPPMPHNHWTHLILCGQYFDCCWPGDIEAEIKWTTFRRWHFQTYFLWWKCLNFD